jgi:hypothetical protein
MTVACGINADANAVEAGRGPEEPPDATNGETRGTTCVREECVSLLRGSWAR